MEQQHDEQTVHSRIEFLIEHLKMNVNSFSVKLGVHPTLIRNVINMKSKPSYDTIKLICEVYGVKADWLVEGLGTIFKDGSEAIESVTQIPNTHQEENFVVLHEELRRYQEREKEQAEIIRNLSKALSQGK